MYYVYVLRCSDNSYYTGYTSNIDRRLSEHNQRIGAKYTRGRTPCVLVYYEEFKEKSAAMKREYEIKTYSKEKKLELIKGDYHESPL